jgi:hypothetical protein
MRLVDIWKQPKNVLRHEVVPREDPNNWRSLQLNEKNCYGRKFVKKPPVHDKNYYCLEKKERSPLGSSAQPAGALILVPGEGPQPLRVTWSQPLCMVMYL